MDMLIQKEGHMKGYHISRGNWISILLDGTVPFEEISGMLDENLIVGIDYTNYCFSLLLSGFSNKSLF